MATPSIDVEVQARATSAGEDVLMVFLAEPDGILDDESTRSGNRSRSITPPKKNYNQATDKDVPNMTKDGDHGIDAAAVVDDENTDLNAVTDVSNLMDTSRIIWIVTTAALPWRTGTSVNPIWRGVYLARRGHTVRLLIPWLADINARKKLYGSANSFPNGQSEQISWIYQNFIGETEIPNFEIKFWNGVYQESMGSIFPTEDICTLIPNEEADVAILEEPEHLNWFRIIKKSKHKSLPKQQAMKHQETQLRNVSSETSLASSASGVVSDNKDSTFVKGQDEISESEQKQKQQQQDHEENTTGNLLFECGTNMANILSDAENPVTDNILADATAKKNSIVESSDDDPNILGWTSKFRYVIGILHTNYGDYIRQYGMMGASFLGTSALHALSTLVVRAYCHKVIRLSDTLPSFWTNTTSTTSTALNNLKKKTMMQQKDEDSNKMNELTKLMEVTSNVHGVRNDFLDPPSAVLPTSKDNNETIITPAPVYFIGKLIWAKGFENFLAVQELYRTHTGNYFDVDIYGGGNDEKAIERAFLGRTGMSRGASNVSDTSSSAAVADNNNDPTTADLMDFVLIEHPEVAATSMDVGSSSNSIAIPPVATDVAAKTAVDTSNIDPLSIIGDLTQKTVETGVETADAAIRMVESIFSSFAFFDKKNNKQSRKIPATNGTIEVIDTTSTLAAKAVEIPVTSTESASDPTATSNSPLMDDNSTNGTATRDGTTTNNKKHTLSPQRETVSLPFHLAPPRARFKWRRNPIPARFLGVKDHIIVRDIPEHKVFLNMSTSEVLCTTSAEALAMGKFVILPKHPSNDFFMQFPNCLGYDSLEDCVVKLQYALTNNAEPLSEKYRHLLSWEGATDRLYEAAAITIGEEINRRKKNVKEISLKAAKFHVEASRKSHYVSGLFGGSGKS